MKRVDLGQGIIFWNIGIFKWWKDRLSLWNKEREECGDGEADGNLGQREGRCSYPDKVRRDLLPGAS